MKKILVILPFFFMSIMAFGESKYFPAGTTWTEVTRGHWYEDWDTTTYVVKDAVEVEGLTYNEVLANGKRYCLLREEGPLVYMWIDEYENCLLYDFDWWEGKEYSVGVYPYEFHDVLTNIEEKVLEDGQTYKIWHPESQLLGDGDDYIICGVGGTNSILKYTIPAIDGGGQSCLLEFTREVQLYNKENGTNGLNEIDTDNQQKSTRSIRLKRNETGGYDLQVKNSDGIWQIIK